MAEDDTANTMFLFERKPAQNYHKILHVKFQVQKLDEM